MNKFLWAGLVAGCAMVASVNAAYAGASRAGAEDTGPSRQPDMEPRICVKVGSYYYCEKFINCREDEDLQMSICDVTWKVSPKVDPK